jgi:predicted nucleic acid-binding Zn ribbon protein
VFEVRQRISEAPLTSHEGCGGEVRRLLSAAPFILKGEGWYVTDYPSEARKKAKDAEKSATAGSTTTSNGDKGGDKGGDKSSATTPPASPASSPAPKAD